MLTRVRGRVAVVVGAIALAIPGLSACTSGASASPSTAGADIVESGEAMSGACMPVTAADPVVTVSNLGLAVLAPKGVLWDGVDLVGLRGGAVVQVDYVLPLPKDYTPENYGIGTFQGYPPTLKGGFISQATWDTRIPVGRSMPGGNSWYSYIIKMSLKPGTGSGSIDGLDFRYHVEGNRSEKKFHTASHLVLAKDRCAANWDTAS